MGGTGSSDNNPGTADRPFATIQKAASVARAGDVVIIRSGVYRETITPSASGTGGNPIIFRPDNGADVVVNGLNDVGNDGWSVHNGNIYKKSINLPVNGYGANITSTTTLLANQIFKGNEMMIEARWPKGIKNQDDLWEMTADGNISNSGWRHSSQFGGSRTFLSQTLTDQALTSFPPGSLVGKTIITQGWFFRNSSTINNHSGSTIGWPDGIWGNNANDQQFRRYYYLTGGLMFLTQEREFHYENGTLYLWQPGGGTPAGIEYKARNWGFDLRGKSHIEIRGLRFFACEPATGDENTSNCTIDNIRASYMNHNVAHRTFKWQGYGMSQYMGTKLLGANNVVKNSEFQWSASQAVWVGANSTVENNLFHHISYDGMWGCPVAFWGNDNVSNIKVLKNTMHTLGRGAIDNGFAFVEGQVKNTTNNEIAYNDIYDFAKLNHDGGAFYSWGYQNLSGTKIHHNWFHDMVSFRPPDGTLTDGIMSAIYFDMGSGATVGQSPLVVHHNVFWNIGDNGGFANTELTDLYELPSFKYSTKQPTQIYNNVFWGNVKSYVTYQNVVGALMRNNISRKDLNFNWGQGVTNVANAMLAGANPQFQGGDQGTLRGLYFRISAASPARNAGVAISGITDGAVGAPDIGAYEYGGEEWVAGYKPVSLPTIANTPPTVSITAPANNSSHTQGNNITITANATDNGSVARVEFYNGNTRIGEDVTSPYSYAWNNVPAGTHRLTARATDNQNATTTSSVVTINVVPSENPTVAITSPLNNTAVETGSTVTINATATRANGTITKVEFYRNGTTKLGEDTSSPYSFVWQNVPAGAHAITARATDNENKTVTSTIVNISAASAQVAPLPTISISSPTNNARFDQGATINIATTSAGTISKVEFFNGSTKLGEDTSNPYTFNWTNVAVGTHQITARATTTNNAQVTSASVDVIVAAPNQGPAVEIVSPASGGSFVPGETITITAESTDADGAVSKVEFFVGDTKVGEDSSSPFSTTWSSKDAGAYSLTAIAWDDKGTITTSKPIEIAITVESERSEENPLTAGIPRFFSPNGDGQGDVWAWTPTELYENSSVTVYNRAGEPVYRSPAYSNAWDGRVNGKPLQDGDYYYVIRLANQTELRGAVRIVR